MRRSCLAVPLLVLAACSPQEAADNVLRRTAQTVVTPVLDDYMTGPQASAATGCVLTEATSDELRLLSRDVGVIPGTSTRQTVLDIAARPGAQSCLTAAGTPLLPR
jgi:hypothetical protein